MLLARAQLECLLRSCAATPSSCQQSPQGHSAVLPVGPVQAGRADSHAAAHQFSTPDWSADCHVHTFGFHPQGQACWCKCCSPHWRWLLIKAILCICDDSDLAAFVENKPIFERKTIVVCRYDAADRSRNTAGMTVLMPAALLSLVKHLTDSMTWVFPSAISLGLKALPTALQHILTYVRGKFCFLFASSHDMHSCSHYAVMTCQASAIHSDRAQEG